MGKVVLARLRPEALARYVGSGLTRYTPSTITSPVKLSQELQRVRANGYAVEREEFDLDFCCVAAPALDEHGRLAGVLGLSASTRAFDNEHDELTAAVRDIAENAAPARPAGAAMELCA
jgi:DNA-binding IclR family transcriptional regulator